MRRPRTVEVEQLSAWIEAKLFRDMKAHVKATKGLTQRAFIEDALRMALRSVPPPVASASTRSP